MKINKAISVLRKHNKHMKAKTGTILIKHPKKIGIAIDTVVDYEGTIDNWARDEDLWLTKNQKLTKEVDRLNQVIARKTELLTNCVKTMMNQKKEVDRLSDMITKLQKRNQNKDEEITKLKLQLDN